ncbi:hypothetical protein GWI33_008858 [Rhynchophorus ferrugineus]|uniref:Uncharacterized protein n=1 Tax=Rhynchophorus ferrugineus TaxID=354439 RepID=A0A834ICC2_RHYFE|nr:hypothetical protein GWI33_008858 [Rhynchophorus ferrugineus]
MPTILQQPLNNPFPLPFAVAFAIMPSTTWTCYFSGTLRVDTDLFDSSRTPRTDRSEIPDMFKGFAQLSACYHLYEGKTMGLLKFRFEMRLTSSNIEFTKLSFMWWGRRWGLGRGGED